MDGSRPLSAGFFDASKLDVLDSPTVDEDGAGDADLRAKYEQSLRECEELRARLAKAESAEGERKELHRKNMQKMLEANEALQAQLKQLNGVVERVVQTSLGVPANAKPQGKLPAAFAPARPAPRKREPRR